MIEDSIDLVYLRTCGLYRIDKEKFVENFLYRFANSVDSTRDYNIVEELILIIQKHLYLSMRQVLYRFVLPGRRSP